MKYFSGFAGEDVGPLDHHDGDEIGRLSIENGFGGVLNWQVGDGADGTEDGVVGWPVESLAVVSCARSGIVSVARVGNQVKSSKIEFVGYGADPVRELCVEVVRVAQQ